MFVFSTVPCNSAPLVFFSTFRLGLLATVPRINFHLIHPIAALSLWRSTVQFPGIWSQLHRRVDGCCLLEWFTLHSIKFLLVIGRGETFTFVCRFLIGWKETCFLFVGQQLVRSKRLAWSSQNICTPRPRREGRRGASDI